MFALLPFVIAICVTICNASGLTGGTKTKIEDHRYVVSFQLENGTHICDGALLHKDTVLTSGQCLLYYKNSKVYVRVGSDRYDKGGEVIPIAAYIINKHFDFGTMDSDIAVVKLKRSVHNSDKVKRIVLPKKQPKTGKKAVLTGWNTNKKLVDVEMTVIRRKECISGKYIYEEKDIKKSMICVDPPKKRICNGVAGSPLVYRRRLIGLVSWANTCANRDNPYVYTNVAKLSKWVKKTAKKLKCK